MPIMLMTGYSRDVDADSTAGLGVDRFAIVASRKGSLWSFGDLDPVAACDTFRRITNH